METGKGLVVLPKAHQTRGEVSPEATLGKEVMIQLEVVAKAKGRESLTQLIGGLEDLIDKLESLREHLDVVEDFEFTIDGDYMDLKAVATMGEEEE